MFTLYTLDHDGHNFWKKVDEFADAIYEAVYMLAKADNNFNYNQEVVIVIGNPKEFVRVATINRKGAKLLLESYGGVAER